MGQALVPGSGNDDPLPETDPMDDQTWAALIAARADEVPPPEDPDPDVDQLFDGDGEALSWTAGLADGGPLDKAVPSGWLAVTLEAAAGIDGRYADASDDEAMGAVAAWERMVSYCVGRRYEALAAVIRHRPAPGHKAETPAGLPGVWDEFTGTEVAHTLADSRCSGEVLVETAYDLAGKLSGTMAALCAGQISEYKARIIQRATVNLDDAEAAAVEDLVLDRAGKLTPGGLRAAVNRAVMEVAPEKARKRREEAARTRHVELRAEDSGNSQIAARELDADVALAIDAELDERARELKQAGVGQDTGDRRVLALLERFGLAGDLPLSPRAAQAGTTGETAGTGAGPGPGPGPGAGAGAGAGAWRAGTAVTVPGRLNLTVPLATLAGETDRPGELSGSGPADPWQARRLGHAALASDGTKVCVTVTDEQGMMTGHGCARPPTRAERATLREHARTGPPGPPRPRGLGLTPFPGQDQQELRGGGGTWVLHPGNGRDIMIVRIWPVTTDPCDHRLLTPAHDPGKELRHLTGLRYGACSGPVCRRPARQCDFEHNKPWEEHGATCLCNGNPKCRFEHRLKQDARWTVTQHPDGTIDWRAPTGRVATTEPHRFPI
jgi:hypothetical protein